MFHSARIRLTAWYLLIIMLISGFFSILAYRGFTKEIGRGFRVQAIPELSDRQLIIRDRRFARFIPFLTFPEEEPPESTTEIFELARWRFALQLLVINGMIFAIAGSAGYFLAGRTLAPIEESMEEQKRFVADASHELKTPLTALQTSVEVALMDKKLTANEARTTLKGSLDDIESLKKLTNDLLSLASFQQDGSKLHMKNVEVDKVVNSAHKKILLIATKKNINVKVDSKNIIIKSNEEILEKLITILLDNAVKYTDADGNISLSTRKNKRNLIIKVADTGIGISKKDLPHVFDRFYRSDTSRSKGSTDGFGLGLSIAKSIVELHGGEIIAESTPGKGSTFTVKLPIS